MSLLPSPDPPRSRVVEDEKWGRSETADLVFEGDLVSTGLLDSEGRPLYRRRNPIGFNLQKGQR